VSRDLPCHSDPNAPCDWGVVCMAKLTGLRRRGPQSRTPGVHHKPPGRGGDAEPLSAGGGGVEPLFRGFQMACKATFCQGGWGYRGSARPPPLYGDLWRAPYTSVVELRAEKSHALLD